MAGERAGNVDARLPLIDANGLKTDGTRDMKGVEAIPPVQNEHLPLPGAGGDQGEEGRGAGSKEVSPLLGKRLDRNVHSPKIASIFSLYYSLTGDFAGYLWGIGRLILGLT